VYAVKNTGGGVLYCFDAMTGEEIWNQPDIGIANGVTIGHDGTLYIIESPSGGDLVALSPDGEILWEYPHARQVKFPPIVDGDGTIYFCSFSSDVEGTMHAVRPDGTMLWELDMPDNVRASPTLGPDGTMYIPCGDRLLYAFKDPAKGDVTLDDLIDGDDVAAFLSVLFGADNDPIKLFAADMNGDGVVNVNDVPLFVEVLLTTPP